MDEEVCLLCMEGSLFSLPHDDGCRHLQSRGNHDSSWNLSELCALKSSLLTL